MLTHYIDIFDAPIHSEITEFSISDGIKFIRTPPVMNAIIMENLSRVAHKFSPVIYQFTHRSEKISEGQFRNIPIEDPGEFKFYTLSAIPESLTNLNDLQNIFLISEFNLSFFFQLQYQSTQPSPICSYNIFNINSPTRWEKITSDYIANINQSHLKTISKNFSDLMIVKQNVNYKFIENSINLYMEISRSYTNDKFTYISLFSVIEMLVCHKPNINISTDSLNHQLANKLEFINHLYGLNEIRSTLYGNIKNGEKFWAELYKVRCEISHGNHESKPLDKIVCKNLDRIVRELLSIAIRQPKEIFYLKKC